MPTESTGTLDMTSSATSGWHLLKFKKLQKMLPPTAMGRISVVLHFACPTSWWKSCFVIYITRFSFRLPALPQMIPVNTGSKNET